MKKQLWLDSRIEKYREDREFKLEGLKLSVTEEICALMEASEITRDGLAKMMGCSNAYITKLLSGRENITLAKLLQISEALGTELKINFIPRGKVKRIKAGNFEYSKFQPAYTGLVGEKTGEYRDGKKKRRLSK